MQINLRNFRSHKGVHNSIPTGISEKISKDGKQNKNTYHEENLLILFHLVGFRQNVVSETRQ